MQEDKVKVVVDVGDDFEEIDIEENDENEEPVNSDIPQDMLIFIQQSVSKSKRQSIAYTDKRIAQVNERLAKHSETLDNHAERIEGLERVVEAMATGKVKAVSVDGEKEKPERNGVLDHTLGTVGDIAHGVVDTAAFLCEAVIDLATLGKARRQ